MTDGTQETSSDKTAIRSFRVGFPEAELTELRRRVKATRWPERETVTDNSQGVRLAMMQDLARWRPAAAGPLTGGENRLRPAEQLLRQARGLLSHHVDAPADVVRAGGLTRRSGGVHARPRRRQWPARARGKGP